MNLDYDEAWDAADDAGIREGMTNDYWPLPSSGPRLEEPCFGLFVRDINKALVFAWALGEGHRQMLESARMDVLSGQGGFVVYFPGYLLDRDPEPAPRDY